MFDPCEHEALMRLMTYATGYVADSQRIAHWLQTWERAENPRKIKSLVPGLSLNHAADIKTLVRAAKREGLRPTELGRLEYIYNMDNISRAYPITVDE